MNAIYLHPSDAFTFLVNVLETPKLSPFVKPALSEQRKRQAIIDDYERALAECIEKRMVIGNPEVFAYKYEAGKYTKWCRVQDAHSAKSVIPWLKEGEIYPRPGTWDK